MLSTIAPDSGRPMPPPMPNIAEIIPMATDRRSAGSSSSMIPKASGNTPPATPWMTRPAITISIEPASPETIEPKAKMQQHDGEDARLAEQVAELARERRAHRRREQEPGEHPGRRRGLRAELPREGGDRRRDERLRQGVGQRGQQERPDHRRGRLAVDRGHRHGRALRMPRLRRPATQPQAYDEVVAVKRTRRPRGSGPAARPCRPRRRARPGVRRPRRAGRRAARA